MPVPIISEGGRWIERFKMRRIDVLKIIRIAETFLQIIAFVKLQIEK
jgi:hypothetical protein